LDEDEEDWLEKDMEEEARACPANMVKPENEKRPVKMFCKLTRARDRRYP